MTKPWYKQFWPWFIIAFPLSAVVASFATLFIFMGAQPDMVIDDYYKQGKAINFQKDKQNKAMELDLIASMQIKGKHLSLRFTSGQKNLDGSVLNIRFFHTTQANRDFQLKALQDASGNYHAQLAEPLTGKWQVSIEPYDALWRLRKTLYFPVDSEIQLTPVSH